MKDFNMRRFCQMMKLDFVQNFRKTYLSFFVGGALAYFLNSSFVCYNWAIPMGGSAEAYESAFTRGLGVFSFTFLLLYLYGLSLSFSCLFQKPYRLNTLMLPASNLEKILYRTVVWTIGVIVSNYVLFGIADLLRQIVFFCFTGDWGSSAYLYYVKSSFLQFDSLTMANLISSTSEQLRVLMRVNSISWSLSTIAVYLWGSTVFRRHAFLATSALCVVIGIFALTVFMNVWVGYFYQNETFFEFAQIAFTILGFVLTVYLLWQTVYNFRHAQLVRRKHF